MKNRRRSYEDFAVTERTDGIPCRACGCRMSYVVKTERIGSVVRRTRVCRHCEATFHTTESA